MPASKITMPEARRAAQMYADGYSQPQIARALGRDRTPIRTALRLLGVPQRTPGEAYRTWLQRNQGRRPAR